ncbi:hypothetical protein J2T17_007448 [Paenibacillus mucilaginosus]
MRLPVHFDGNEWFSTISLLIMFALVLFLPRRFPKIVSFVFLVIGSGTALFVDFHFGLPPVDMYDVNDLPLYEWFDLVNFLLYSPFAYVFLYLFDWWKPKGIRITWYVLAWSLAGVAYEWVSVTFFHLYNYGKGWQFGYSFVFYLTSQAFTVWFYYMVKHCYNRTKNRAGPEWA